MQVAKLNGFRSAFAGFVGAAALMLASMSVEARDYREGTIRVEPLPYSTGGHAIWLDRRDGSGIKAKYFAVGQRGLSVYQTYEQWKASTSGIRVVLACSGAFSGSSPSGRPALPVGLTVQDGAVVNRNVDSIMDALVIVFQTGGVVVSNIENGDLLLASRNKRVNVRDAVGKEEALAWAKAEEATLFQTQLLVYEDKLMLATSAATKESRERRMLALARHQQDKSTLYHVIIDVKDATYLGNAAVQAKSYINGKGYEVVALMNLDTGAYDALEVSPEGRRLDQPAGKQTLQQSTNLVVYYVGG